MTRSNDRKIDASNKAKALYLDYDGTISPIADAKSSLPNLETLVSQCPLIQGIDT